jgi:hypothetical protein
MGIGRCIAPKSPATPAGLSVSTLRPCMWDERTTATLRQERAGHSVGSASDFNLATSSSGRPLFEVDQALHHDSHLLVNLAITESVQGQAWCLGDPLFSARVCARTRTGRESKSVAAAFHGRIVPKGGGVRELVVLASYPKQHQLLLLIDPPAVRHSSCGGCTIAPVPRSKLRHHRPQPDTADFQPERSCLTDNKVALSYVNNHSARRARASARKWLRERDGPALS